MSIIKLQSLVLSLSIILQLTACGGSESDEEDEVELFFIGGMARNLAGEVALQLSVANTIVETKTVSANGDISWRFETKQIPGVDFAIQITTQPSNQLCTISNASGKLTEQSAFAAEVVCTNNPTEPLVLTGKFVDSPVINISYSTATQQGSTNDNGEFQYMENESVTFAIGDITFPSVTAAELVTPLDLVSTTDINHPQLINILRLIQSLDTDANPDNGINISDAALANATAVEFDLPVAEFAALPAISNLLANAGLESVLTELVSTEQAQTHFQQTLVQLGLIEGPLTPTGCDEDVTYSLTGQDFIMASNTPVEVWGLSGSLSIAKDGSCQLSVNEGYSGPCRAANGSFSALNGRLIGTIANSQATILNLSRAMTIDREYVSAYITGTSSTSCVDEAITNGTYNISGRESVSQDVGGFAEVYNVTGTLTVNGNSCSVTSSEGSWSCQINGNAFQGAGGLIKGTITQNSVSYYLLATSDGTETVFGQYSGSRN